MDDDLIGKGRTVLKVVPAVISLAVLVMAIIAMLMPNGTVAISALEPASISIDGMEVCLDGTYEIKSDLPYSVDDLSISVIATDEDAGSRITIWSSDDIRIAPGSSAVINIHSEFFSPVLILFVEDLLSHADPSITVTVSASCKYMMRMTDVNVDVRLESPLSQPGQMISYNACRPAQSEFTLEIDGLADHLVPGDSSIRIYDDHTAIDIDVSSSDGYLTICIGSKGDLDSAIESLNESGHVAITDGHGMISEIGSSDTAVMLNALSAIMGLA